MTNLLYIVVIILIVGWAVGLFAYNAGGGIHVLLILAIVLYLATGIKR